MPMLIERPDPIDPSGSVRCPQLGCIHIAANDNALRTHFASAHAEELKRAGFKPCITYKYRDEHIITIKKNQMKDVEDEIKKLQKPKDKNWLSKTRNINPLQGPMAPRVQAAIVSHLQADKKREEPELPDLAKELRRNLTHCQPSFAAGSEATLAASAASSAPSSSTDDTPQGCKWGKNPKRKEISPVKDTG